MRDLQSVLCWIHKNHKFFHGKVTEPVVLPMTAEDQQEARREVLEGECMERKDPFTFIFHNQEDRETFFSNYLDKMGLKVNAMFV